MIDTNKRLAQSESRSLRGLESDKQGIRQTWTLRRRDGVELRAGNSRFPQGRLRDGQQIFQMLARGEFGHNPTVFSVQGDLRSDDVGKNCPIAHNRSAGFITGSF